MPEREELLSIVRAMAAGLPVDWAEIESSASDESLREAIRELRVISEIASLHHSFGETSPSIGSSSPSIDAATAPAIDDSMAPDRPQATWGPFILIEQVGHGSFGDVYRARDGRLDREVALKLLRGRDETADKAGSIIDEGRLLARVRHPNVVTVHGADRIEGRIGLWMEYVDGRTLEQCLREDGPFSAAGVIEVGVEICRALSAVHQAGLLHRDIKAQNVMRQPDGRLVLMDFGAGRDLDATAVGSDVAGTPLYLAPEIFNGQAATVQTDLYSVGILLYHLLTGGYPVTGRTIREVREAHQRLSHQQERSDLPDPLGRILNRALAINPVDRFATADEMATALTGLMAPPPEVRRRVITGASLAGLLVSVAVIVALSPAGWRDRLLGRPGQPGQPRQAGAEAIAAGDHALGVRQVLNAGEYSDLGRPSPDGRYFSFVDNNADLAVKEIGTGRLRRLTTHGQSNEYAGASSTMSPDGKWIAYSWGGSGEGVELRVLALESDGSSAPRVLARNAGLTPIEWSGDGTQILSLIEQHDGSRQLSLIAAADGTVRPVKDLKTRLPLGTSLSPDARFIVYDQPQADNPRARDIFVSATDGSGAWPLVEHPASDMFPEWMSDDRVLFTSDRTGVLGLWTIRVSEGRPLQEAEVISRDMGRMTPLGPTRGGAFYYRAETGLVDVYTAEIEPGSGRIVGKPQPVWPNRLGSNISSDWAADGRRLAYVKIRNPAGAAQADAFSRILAIREVASREEREVWPPLAFFIAPRWSPDGRAISVSGCDLEQRCGFHIIDVASGRVISHGQGGGWVRWTRDGRQLLFVKGDHLLVSRDIATGIEAVLLDSTSIGVDRFTPPSYGAQFDISPDGKSLAFSGWIGRGTGAHTVIDVLPFDARASGSKERNPTNAVREVAQSRRSEPMFFQGWTPDGADLLFTKPIGAKSGGTQPPDALWRLSVFGGEPRHTGLELAGLRDVHVNADGTRLTFTAGWQTGDVRVMENFLPR